MFISAAASAQVDTLQLVEIGSIQAPSEITELYVEDLDGDSLKEIIICTEYYVYIYDSETYPTYQLEWTSTPLVGPTDLLFEDINNDGLIDLSVKDSANIHLFDPHTPQTIWTSPELGDRYICYTIGDRNYDDLIDIAIVWQYWYPGVESASVHIFDGIQFQDTSSFYVIYPNYYVEPSGGWYYEGASSYKIIIGSLSGEDGNRPRIILYSDFNNGLRMHGDETYSTTGKAHFVDGITLDVDRSYLGGLELCSYFNYENNWNRLICIMHAHFRDNYGPDPWNYQHVRSVQNHAFDSTLSDFIFWETTSEDDTTWKGFIVSEINYANDGLENCYSAEDSLILLIFPEVDTIWMHQVPDIDSVLHRFADSSLYASPQVICGIGDPLIEYQFFNGADGSLSGVLPDAGYELSEISDLNNDQRDEILSIQSASLYIYNIDYATDIGHDSMLPHRSFLRPNFPNPFNSSTTIEYGLPEAEQVRIDIYDLLGRKVETLIDGEMQAGRHQVVWDASAYSSGVYFYRLEAGDFVDTKRMVYLK
jgi:hypothetical protein